MKRSKIALGALALAAAVTIQLEGPAEATDDIVSVSGQVNYPTIYGDVECHYASSSTNGVHSDGRLMVQALATADEPGEIDGCEIWGARTTDFYIKLNHQQYHPSNGWTNINTSNLWWDSFYNYDQDKDSWAGREVRTRVQACQVGVGCQAYVTIYDSTGT